MLASIEHMDFREIPEMAPDVSLTGGPRIHMFVRHPRAVLYCCGLNDRVKIYIFSMIFGV